MKNLREIEKDFFDKLTNILDEQFPKGECKERGKALVLNAYANIYLKEALSLFKQQMKEIIGGMEEIELEKTDKEMNLEKEVGHKIDYSNQNEFIRNKFRNKLLKNIEGL